jgi:hypothetical protein
MKQLHDRQVFEPINASKLSVQGKEKYLRVYFLLKRRMTELKEEPEPTAVHKENILTEVKQQVQQ